MIVRKFVVVALIGVMCVVVLPGCQTFVREVWDGFWQGHGTVLIEIPVPRTEASNTHIVSEPRESAETRNAQIVPESSRSLEINALIVSASLNCLVVQRSMCTPVTYLQGLTPVQTVVISEKYARVTGPQPRVAARDGPATCVCCFV